MEGRHTSFLDRHTILVAGLVIYGYFFLTSLNLLQQNDVQLSFLDVVFHFDSLMVMWIIAAAVIQLQKYRKATRVQEKFQRRIQLEFERQRTQLEVMDDVTRLLQDSVNNPLAVISVTSQNLHRRFENDSDATAQLDRIDSAVQRVHTTIKDIRAYQTQRIVQESPFMQETRMRGLPVEETPGGDAGNSETEATSAFHGRTTRMHQTDR